MLCINNINIRDKKILIRVDFNVPIKNGIVLDASRIYANIETINYALDQNCAIILISHLGDPDPVVDSLVLNASTTKLSLKIVVPILEKILNQPINFISDWFDKSHIDVDCGKIFLCENIRLTAAEKQNDAIFAQRLANLAEVVIMDAFATAHRKHASTYGILSYAKIAAAGFLLYREFNILQQALFSPIRPLVAIVGGAKISTKIKVLEALSKVVDYLILGGAIANTCLLASGYKIGTSLSDNNFLELARALDRIILPVDAIVINSEGIIEQKDMNSILEQDCILDIGKSTIKKYKSIIKQANTILWNGPLGKTDDHRFINGTKCLAEAIIENSGLSIVGGGDTLAVIKQLNLSGFSYVSTGGGALLTFLENHTLPMIELLNKFD